MIDGEVESESDLVSIQSVSEDEGEVDQVPVIRNQPTLERNTQRLSQNVVAIRKLSRYFKV